jgi:VWFA-related protein
MISLRILLLCDVILLASFYSPLATSAQQIPPLKASSDPAPSRTIFLDATVLDRDGHPVVKGLTSKDFVITEDDRAQQILSFEPPVIRGGSAAASTDDETGQESRTVLVLDALNSSFQDIAFIRTSVRNYLLSQPTDLKVPTEMLVLDNHSLEMAQSYTQKRSELLQALDRESSVIHDQEKRDSFFEDRYKSSVEALQQIALQNKGIPGPKNIVWVGRGAPNFVVNRSIGDVAPVTRYAHETADLLLEARMSLFLMYPGMPAENLPHGEAELNDASTARASIVSAQSEIGTGDPFADNMNFGVFVKLTGGALFFDQNNVPAELERVQGSGSTSYTLSYVPPAGEPNGRFRRIHVTLRDPALRVLTKAGYFAPDKTGPMQAQQQMVANLTEVARSRLTFPALKMTVQRVVRHPDTGTVDVTAMVELANAVWLSSDNGRSATTLVIAVAGLDSRRKVITSRVESIDSTAATQDASRLAREVTRLAETIHYSQKTRNVRVVVENTESGRMGAIELDRKALDAAPEAPTPTPQLVQHLHASLRETSPEQ